MRDSAKKGHHCDDQRRLGEQDAEHPFEDFVLVGFHFVFQAQQFIALCRAAACVSVCSRMASACTLACASGTPAAFNFSK